MDRVVRYKRLDWIGSDRIQLLFMFTVQLVCCTVFFVQMPPGRTLLLLVLILTGEIPLVVHTFTNE